MSRPANTSELLRAHNIRPSLQRIAVMDYLLTHRTHPTADEIYGALAPHIPTLSKTTVYNTLALLVEHGAAAHITIDPRESRFDGDTSPHGHFLCTVCGTLYDVFFDPQPQLPLPPGGHAVASTQIYYRGTHPTPIRDYVMTGYNAPCRIGEAICMPGDVVFGRWTLKSGTDNPLL